MVSLVVHVTRPVSLNIYLQSFEPHAAAPSTLLRLGPSDYWGGVAQMVHRSSISTSWTRQLLPPSQGSGCGPDVAFTDRPALSTFEIVGCMS